MGGRGSNSGIDIKQSGNNNLGWWDSRGMQRRLAELESAFENSRSENTRQKIWSALNRFDNTISVEMNDQENDQRVLMSLRRRARQLRRKIEQSGQ